MCTKNNDGGHPSCFEAKFFGPGCGDFILCDECLKVLEEEFFRYYLALKRITNIESDTDGGYFNVETNKNEDSPRDIAISVLGANG